MDMTALLAFAALALTLILVPGADWAFILASGARDRVVGPAVGGIMGGYVVLGTAVVLGIGPVVAAVPMMLTVLTFAGAAYMIHLGIRTFRSAASAGALTASDVVVPAPHAYVVRGMGVSALNPKALLLFLALLPQFALARAPWPLTAQLAVLCAVYIVICGTVYVALGLAARQLIGTRPRFTVVITRVAGVSMVIVGLVLLAERVVEYVA